jgi:hypothetical protein
VPKYHSTRRHHLRHLHGVILDMEQVMRCINEPDIPPSLIRRGVELHGVAQQLRIPGQAKRFRRREQLPILNQTRRWTRQLFQKYLREGPR